MSPMVCRNCAKVSQAYEVELVHNRDGLLEERCPYCGGEVDIIWYPRPAIR